MNDTPTAPENMPTAPETTTTETPISVPEAAPETGSPASSDPKPSKKGINWKFIAIIATVVLFGALLGGGGAYYYMAAQDNSSDTTAEATPTPTATATPTPTPSTTSTPTPTPTTSEEMKEFSDSSSNAAAQSFDFKYPDSWYYVKSDVGCFKFSEASDGVGKPSVCTTEEYSDRVFEDYYTSDDQKVVKTFKLDEHYAVMTSETNGNVNVYVDNVKKDANAPSDVGESGVVIITFEKMATTDATLNAILNSFNFD